MGNSFSSHFVTEIANKQLLAQITQNKQLRCTDACGRFEDDMLGFKVRAEKKGGTSESEGGERGGQRRSERFCG